MAEFTVIETQEQLDRVIGERIRRAEEKEVVFVRSFGPEEWAKINEKKGDEE